MGRTGSHRLCTDRESQKARFIGVAAAAIDYGTRNSPVMRQAGHQPPPDRSFYLAESVDDDHIAGARHLIHSQTVHNIAGGQFHGDCWPDNLFIRSTRLDVGMHDIATFHCIPYYT